ncbi:MAG: FecR family protein [Candidatus Aminicenantes bacterium]
MKKLFILFACFAFLTSPVLYAEEEGSYQYSYARLSYVKGDVFIERAGDMGYEEGVVNLPVVEGDKMGTREGRAEIHFGRKNYLRINSFTQLDFVELPKRGNDAIKLHLMSGSVFLRVSYLDEDMSFEIHTPDASFYIVEAGLYRFSVREDRETELLVYEGAVEAAGEEGSLLVESEQKLLVSNGYFASDPVDFYGRLDDSFSQWNNERDNLLSRPADSNYLPEELDEYEEELADNGRWVYERPYGYVWVPYVVHHEWRPYYYGRWCWYPVIGWTWVSYDPWGWCVTHYGRWHWRWGLGWYWIPTRVWGPAWVHWCWGYDYIGWCPLSYYGHPAVVVNNYFYGHHYGRYYPARSRALTVVRKNQLQARNISRVALSRTQVSRIEKISLSARQPLARRSITKSSLRNSTAAKVLSRDSLRSVERSYSSGNKLSVSRSRSTESVNTTRVIRKSATAANRQGLKEQPRRITDARKLSSRSSRVTSRSSGESKSRVSRNSASESRIKTYPSRKSSVSRSNAVSSSERRSTVSSREGKSRVEKSTSRTYPSRIKKESRSNRSRNSGSTPSRSSNLRRSSSSRIQSSSTRKRSSSSSSSLSSSLRRSGSGKARSVNARRSSAPSSRSSAVRRSSSRRSSASSARSSSRSVSSRRSSASSSKVSSSRSGRSSSSRGVSRSSSRSSSSRSSSRSSSSKSIKKK